MRFRWTLLFLIVATLSLPALAQSENASGTGVCADSAQCTKEVKAIAKEFGPEFKPLPQFPPLFGDLDGDGQEDAVVVATGSPLGGQEEFDYKVVDPYNAYFGWGDPKVTNTFVQMAPGPKREILVVHDWKAEKPKAKFVIINLPFEKLSLGRAMVKKKTVRAISAEESSSLLSVTYWDGKRYRWRATGMAE